MRRRNLDGIGAILELKFWKVNPLTSVSVSLTGLAVNLGPRIFLMRVEAKQKTAATGKKTSS
jgi:hypothetical protein